MSTKANIASRNGSPNRLLAHVYLESGEIVGRREFSSPNRDVALEYAIEWVRSHAPVPDRMTVFFDGRQILPATE